jgi:D-alanyl-D-alanine carboxypeptidase (penicillin-binding protein 5/6)
MKEGLKKNAKYRTPVTAFLAVVISSVVIAAAVSFAPAAEARAPGQGYPEISAQAAAVLDTSSGRFLYEKESDRRMKIASTTKIMTALVVLENADREEVVRIKRDHYAIGSSMYLREGEELRVRDLLYGLMLMSGNDAALALADHCAGGKEEFAKLMNKKAEEIEMSNSSFRNPHGLDEDGHYSTARDMALLAAYAMKNDVFREIVGTKSGHIAGRYMKNHNRLLTQIDGATGLKTGYTTSAGRCLVSSVERDGREIIVVTLNAPDDWRDHAALYKRAFDSYTASVAVEKDHIYAYIPVICGDTQMVGVRAEETIRVWITEGENVQRVLYLPKFIYAPVMEGDIAGEVAVLIDGREIRRIPLCYDSGAALVPQKVSLGDRIAKFFKNLVRAAGF